MTSRNGQRGLTVVTLSLLRPRLARRSWRTVRFEQPKPRAAAVTDRDLNVNAIRHLCIDATSLLAKTLTSQITTLYTPAGARITAEEFAYSHEVLTVITPYQFAASQVLGLGELRRTLASDRLIKYRWLSGG
jgi:hypothetical protein